jgi:elongation factor P
MIYAGDFRNGVIFEMDSQVFQVVEFQHVKPGKGAAFVRTKYRNVKTGGVVERSFNPSDKFESAQLERRDMSYLYSDGDLYFFMDVDTFDQVPFSGASVGDALKFLKDGMVCKVVSYKGEVFAIEPPIFVELEVTECDPGVKGDTAQNATKNAEVETGAVIKVPLFVNQGDMVKIDTRTGEYMERVKA